MTDYHVPVLLNEVLEFLQIVPGRKYIDCTLGGGGHSREIIKRGGTLLSLDQDSDAADYVTGKIASGEWGIDREVLETRWFLRKANFDQVGDIAGQVGFNNVSGVLFDLGVSSHQLETDSRGFSFNREGMLDMRMDRDLKITAADLVNAGSQSELARLFWRFGEERESRRIAKAIVSFRQTVPITTTNQLAKIVSSVSRRGKYDRTHPATRVFQALRMAVNSELPSLDRGINQAWELLEPGGRLIVISFHSLEDRLVKNKFRHWSGQKLGRILTKAVVQAGPTEVLANPRARSGKLRVIEAAIGNGETLSTN